MIITSEYKDQLQQLHKNPKTFNSEVAINNGLSNFIETHNPTSLIDFGCGKGYLINKLSGMYPHINLIGYDPGNKEFETLPTTSSDVLVSTDVLEHIEPRMLTSTLAIINSLFTDSCYLLIAGYPAKKILPDGRNAHLIIESFEWWKEQLSAAINGTIIKEQCVDINKINKKGPPTVGQEYIFIIKK